MSLEAYLTALPQTVALVEPEAGFPRDRQALAQVVAEADGRGLVGRDSGLTPLLGLAQKAGVPAGGIYRDIDGAGQDPAAIRRFIDQAAFRAGIEGRVIVVGHARPDTLAALTGWTGSPRAATVALAPLSAVLLGQ